LGGAELMGIFKAKKNRGKPALKFVGDKSKFPTTGHDDGLINALGQKVVGLDIEEQKLKSNNDDVTIDELEDGSAYKRTTANEKTGAGLAYDAIDESTKYLQTGIKASGYGNVSANNVSEGVYLARNGLVNVLGVGVLSENGIYASGGNLTNNQIKDGHTRATSGLDTDGYVSLGVKSGTTVKDAARIVSELNKTSIALDASGNLQSGIVSKLGTKTADDIIGYDTSNLILNPLFKESDTNWINPDATKNTIVDSFVEFLDKGDPYIITPTAISYDSGNKEYSISCSWVTEIDDALSDGNAYVRFEGDPTSALEGVIARVTKTSTGVINIQAVKQFTSIDNAEKFKIGFKSARSDKALKMFGLVDKMKTEPVPIKSNDAINLSISFDFCFDYDFPSSRGVYVYLWVLDNTGIKMFYYSFPYLKRSDFDYDCYRSHYETLEIDFKNLPSQIYYQEDGFVINDISYLQIEVQSLNDTATGSLYFTGLQVNYGDAVYVEPKDTKVSSSNITKTLNYVFSNASAVDNIKSGKRPDGKFVSPKNNYSALVVTMDINKASTETEFTILESDVRGEIGSNIDLDTDDRVIDAIMQVKIDKGSNVFDIVDSTKDVSVEYETYNSVTVLKKIVVANCPTTEEDYRVTFTCNLQNCPS
jgi:hypothetical protein